MRAISILILLAIILPGCSRYRKIDKATLEKRTLTVGNVYATYYPVTHKNAYVKDTIVLTDPILLDKSILHRGPGGGLIAFLNYQGYPVWLVHMIDYNNVNLEKFGRSDLPRALMAIKKFSRETQFVIGGLSLGGQAALYFVEKYIEDTSLSFDLTRIFFIGTGFDYKYPQSFARVTKKEKLKSLKSTCPNPALLTCRYLKSAYREIKGEPYLNYLPQLEQDPTKRFAFIKNLAGPILFISGNIDNVAPPESVFNTYRITGANINPAMVARDINKLFFEASEINGFRFDYDHFALFMGPYTDEEVYLYLVQWLKGRRLG